MALNKRPGCGTYLYIDPAGGTDWEVVEGVVESIESGVSVEQCDTTLLGDAYQTSVPVDKKLEPLKFSIALDNANETNQVISEMRNDNLIGAFKVEFTDDETHPFTVQGYISADNFKVGKRDMLVRDIEVTLTGPGGLYAGSGA